MRLRLISAGLAVAHLSLAGRINPRNSRGWCGTADPSPAFMDATTGLNYVEADEKSGRLRPRQEAGGDRQIIPTVVHTVSSKGKEGQIGEDRINSQIQVMQQSYDPHDFEFDIQNINHFVDDDLAAGPFSDPDAFRKFLTESRTGAYNVLNLYFYTDYPAGQFGLCTLPEGGLVFAPEEDIFDDGCHINAGTMPGGDIDDYNLGYTVVHEVGHWLGLLHTFNGHSCTGRGDLIDDTPFQQDSTTGCPERQNTCPDQEGDDPIHNYMDYSSDPCYQEFTWGQRVRMHNSWSMYRVA